MIDTWDKLMKELEQVTETVTNITAKEVSELLRKNLEDLWYSQPNNRYIRTYDMLNAISYLKKNKNYYIVSFDDDKIRQQVNEGKLFNSHMSLNEDTSYEGMSIGQWVANWMEYGQESSVYAYDGVGYVKQTMEQIWQIGQKIDKELKTLGYDIKVGF